MTRSAMAAVDPPRRRRPTARVSGRSGRTDRAGPPAAAQGVREDARRSAAVATNRVPQLDAPRSTSPRPISSSAAAASSCISGDG